MQSHILMSYKYVSDQKLADLKYPYFKKKRWGKKQVPNVKKRMKI